MGYNKVKNTSSGLLLMLLFFLSNKKASIPEFVTAELSEDRLYEERTSASPPQKVLHNPFSQSTRRCVVGDRFHTSTNPNKSNLCAFHDINLCLHKNTLKTSYLCCMSVAW